MKILFIIVVLLSIRTCPANDFTEPGCGGCTPPCYEEHIAGDLTSADSVKNILVSLVDGGNTQALVDMIQIEKQRGKVKDTLLVKSPYLSDRVLIELITKNKPYPDGIIKEVILANSPVTDTVLNTLLNRQPLLATGIIKEILDAQQGISARALLENQINFFLSEAALAQNNLISWFIHNDSLGGIDSIIPILDKDTLIDSKLMLTSAYLATGDTANAQLLIDSLALIPETQNFAALQQLFIDFGDTLFSVILNDSAIRQQIAQIAADTTKAGSMQARILLEQLFNQRINEVFIFPNQIQLKTSGTKEAELISDEFVQDDISPETKQYEGYRLNNYPNPYSEGTIIAAYIPADFPESEVVVLNIIGKTLKHYTLKHGHNFIEISETELPYGINFYSLVADKIKIETKKIVHIK